MNKLLKILKVIWFAIKKPFTHNLCDRCGFTNDEVYVTEVYSEGGFIECTNCINKKNKN